MGYWLLLGLQVFPQCSREGQGTIQIDIRISAGIVGMKLKSMLNYLKDFSSWFFFTASSSQATPVGKFEFKVFLLLE